MPPTSTGSARGPPPCCTSRAPGGRACINIPLDSNKGGKRAIYADYLRIFQDVGWTYQTSIVWNEQNISRRTAWGSWLSPSAPFVTAPVEMIAVFHKGSFRRPATGGRRGDITRDEFLAWTLGMWTFAGANPRRVGHPAPFPEELPRRLIKLYSYPGRPGAGSVRGLGHDAGGRQAPRPRVAGRRDQPGLLRPDHSQPANRRAGRGELDGCFGRQRHAAPARLAPALDPAALIGRSARRRAQKHTQPLMRAGWP